MNKRILLRNLNKAADWVAAKQRDHDQAVNIMVGCFYILHQAGHHDMSGWLDRKPHRRRLLANIRESYLTKRGNKVLRDLVRLTNSAVESCTWVDNWLPGALPTPVVQKTLTKSHLAALKKGRESRQKKLEKLRLQRDRYHSTNPSQAAS